MGTDAFDDFMDDNTENIEMQDSVVEKTPTINEDVLYSGDGIEEAISDIQAGLDFGSEDYETLEDIRSSVDMFRDYTPEEVDMLFAGSNVSEQVLSNIEDQIIKLNKTNLTRKESFIQDTDEDIRTLNNLIGDLTESQNNSYTIAGIESLSEVKEAIKNIIQKLESLKNSYDGSIACWDTDDKKIENAQKNRVKILTLPEEEE